MAFVKQEEDRNGEGVFRLSEVLKDSKRQQLATAMRLYQSGKVGWYSKLIDQFVLGAWDHDTAGARSSNYYLSTYDATHSTSQRADWNSRSSSFAVSKTEGGVEYQPSQCRTG